MNQTSTKQAVEQLVGAAIRQYAVAKRGHVLKKNNYPVETVHKQVI